MGYPKLDLLIDGQFRQGSAGEAEDVINPATEEAIGSVPHASASDLDEALAAAEKGFETWRGMTALARQAIINKACDILMADIDTHARNLTMEMGKPVGEAKIEMWLGIDVLRWYGEEGKRAYGRIVPSRIPGARQMVMKEPIGVATAFVAWNFPCMNVVRKVGGRAGRGLQPDHQAQRRNARHRGCHRPRVPGSGPAGRCSERGLWRAGHRQPPPSGRPRGAQAFIHRFRTCRKTLAKTGRGQPDPLHNGVGGPLARHRF